MFVCVARVTLQIHESGSLKAKRMVIRKVTDRLKARFNVAVAEVADNDLWQRATLGFAVIGNDRRHCDEQMQKILHAVEEMYVAPIVQQQTETVALGDRLFSRQDIRPTDVIDEVASGADGEKLTPEQAMADLDRAMQAAMSERSMAEAEGMGDWEGRTPASQDEESGARPKHLDEARARARSLRNPRDWEK